MGRLMYFDSLCEIGPRLDKDAAAPWSLADALRWMDHGGIAGALLTHTASVWAETRAARAELARAAAQAPGRLFPAWSIVPPQAGDAEPSPAALLAAMRRAGVRAVKLHPRTHNWPLTASVIGPTLEALQKAGILTLIDYADIPGGETGVSHGAFSALDAILSAFPDLPVLLQRAWWSSQRAVCPLMERHPRLHLELSCYQISRGIEEYAGRFGAARLLFGTGLPAMSAGAARAYIDYADLPPADRALIAGGNLARLLGAAPAGAPAAPRDALRRRAARGVPLGVPVLDAHCHMLLEGADSAGPYVMYRGDAAGMLELQDRLGIRKTAAMSWSGPIACEPVAGNDIVARSLRRFPGRYLGVADVNPTHLPPARLMAEVRRRVEKQGFVGLKPYYRLGLRYNDPLYAPIWDYADRKGLYALLHTGGAAGGMDVVADLAKRYPRAQWLVAHTGGSFAMARGVAAVMREHPNVWAELTLTPVTNGVIEWLAAEVGDDRILFGTDAPMRDPRQQLGWVAWADLPAASRRKILGDNFRRLLAMRR